MSISPPSSTDNAVPAARVAAGPSSSARPQAASRRASNSRASGAVVEAIASSGKRLRWRWASSSAPGRISTRQSVGVVAKYTGLLAAADVFTVDNAWTLLESLRIDAGVLGPFGVHP
ncbi:hypothetical protein [Streptomyces sp. NPDC058548]|uniref:hypothetical protein n=1 Tax=unclassified Streptomyces TaxID=2593676 RepID=UPI0036622956